MDDRMISLTTKLVVAYLEKGPLAASALPELIRRTHDTLVSITAPEPPAAERPQPAVPVRKSVTGDAIICLECGKGQKTLKRHLSSSHGLSVEDYRAKWGLPADYPMVSPDYAVVRSEMAKKIGLGRKTRDTVSAAETSPPAAAALPPASLAEAEAGLSSPAAETEEASRKVPSHRYPASRWAKPQE